MPGHRKRRQFKQTDAFTRGMVIGLKRAGWSIRQIAADTQLGASTVHRLWRRWLEQGNVAIYRNAGATRVTSARVDRRILRQAVAAPQATCTAILQHVQDTLDHSISTRTISRRLVANGLHSCRPLRRLPLTPPNRRQRLEWCRARSTWMTEWPRVVFSDESRFCLSSDSCRVRVWRRRGERSNPAAILKRPTVRQRGIMVWGAIAYDSRSPLLRIQGTMTAKRYVDAVLRPVTLPYLQGVPNALYQQDNARPHTARISQQALQDVQMLPWPPYSPDLSPIEHVWDIIGRHLHALPQPRSEDELWQMVEREWRAIPQDAIRTLTLYLDVLLRASPRYRNAIAIETPLQSETRRALRRLRYSEARVAAAQTMQVPVQRIQLWTHKPFSGLQYNTHIDYKADSSVDIGQMSRVCQFCSALRFRDEPFGLCCKQGSVSLPAIECSHGGHNDQSGSGMNGIAKKDEACWMLLQKEWPKKPTPVKAEASHTQDIGHCECCDRDSWRHLRLFIRQQHREYYQEVLQGSVHRLVGQHVALEHQLSAAVGRRHHLEEMGARYRAEYRTQMGRNRGPVQIGYRTHMGRNRGPVQKWVQNSHGEKQGPGTELGTELTWEETGARYITHTGRNRSPVQNSHGEKQGPGTRYRTEYRTHIGRNRDPVQNSHREKQEPGTELTWGETGARYRTHMGRNRGQVPNSHGEKRGPGTKLSIELTWRETGARYRTEYRTHMGRNRDPGPGTELSTDLTWGETGARYRTEYRTHMGRNRGPVQNSHGEKQGPGIELKWGEIGAQYRTHIGRNRGPVQNSHGEKQGPGTEMGTELTWGETGARYR
ncbi:hypothetical protein LAZ67_6003583 [Cordylochernes scorpioides]|uniref:Transposable element Tc1 transposase n=1 Tax=Cordylochernes scorpioides TaxID=51811 RepID=A0ABY6KKP4_9ARAC|nr:hypothetical protein LAZ67_6003583 [Cordylochernes scorpioides]